MSLKNNSKITNDNESKETENQKKNFKLNEGNG